MNKPLTLLILLLLLFSATGYSQEEKDVFDVARTGTVEQLTALEKKDTDVLNDKNDMGHTPLILACYYNNTEIVKYLVSKKEVDVNGSAAMGTPLMAAAVKGNTLLVKILLDHGADPNLSDGKGTTALHYATMFQNTEMVEILVKAKADFSLKDESGKSPLDYATVLQNEKLLTLFKNNK